MKIAIALVGLIIFLVLRRTRFRNRYSVMSDEWIEMTIYRSEDMIGDVDGNQNKTAIR